MTVPKAVEETSKGLGCDKGIVYSIRKDSDEENHAPAAIEKAQHTNIIDRNARLQLYDERIQMLPLRNVPSTLYMILCATNNEEDILNFSRNTLCRILRGIDFPFEQVEKNILLMDCDDNNMAS
ncbi:hypothetical protein Trydic_g16998 [Trypoxylus dichotomus]